MGKKILVLNGSPRANGNTETLADAFIAGAKGAGHEVAKFDLQKMNIAPCLGCYKCAEKKGTPCIQKDDMDKIYPAYREADVLVFASPLYYWSFSAQLKAAFDRIFAVTGENDMVTPFKECVMLIAAEGDTEDNFKPMVDYYRSVLHHLGWKDAGMVLAGGVVQVGDIAGTKFLGEAEKLGASLA